MPISYYDAFISSADEDVDFANRIRVGFELNSRRIWRNIPHPTINDAWWIQMNHSHLVIFIVTEASMASPICHIQLSYALSLERRVIFIYHHPADREASLRALAKNLTNQPDLDAFNDRRNIVEMAVKNWQNMYRHYGIFIIDEAMLAFKLPKLILMLDESLYGDAQSLLTIGQFYFSQLDKNPREIEDIFKTAMSFFRVLGDEAYEAYCLSCLGELFLYRENNSARASEMFIRAFTIYMMLNAHADVAFALFGFGNIFLRQRKIVEGERYYQEAQKYFRYSGNSFGLANIHLEQGFIALSKGDRDDVYRTFHSSLMFFKKHKNHLQEARARYGLAEIALRTRGWKTARKQYRAALFLMQKHHNLDGQADVMLGLGHLDYNQWKLTSAMTKYEQALALYRATHNALGQANSLYALGNGLRMNARLDEATQAYETALALCRSLGNRHTEADILLSLRLCKMDLDDWSGANIYYEESLTLSRKIGYEYNVACVLMHLVDIALKKGDLSVAQENSETALAIFQAFRDTENTANIFVSLGIIRGKLGDLDGAREWFNQAISTFRSLGNQGGYVVALRSLGIVYLQQKIYLVGDRLLSQALAIAEKRVYLWDILNIMSVQARSATERGKTERACQIYAVIFERLRGTPYEHTPIAAKWRERYAKLQCPE
jgi:tetratricopeptide (TPR) repeat protein